MSKKITYAKIENYKGIKSLEVDNLSRFVGVFGSNGAGKSSFLEAIKNAIKLEHNWNSKVRYWEENGLIEVHFWDEFKIKRVVGSKGKLEVEIDWASIKRPQEWLDSVFLWSIGDPQKFISLPRSDKTRYILSTYGKEEEYNQLESERQKYFEQRTELWRKTRSKEQEVESVDISIFEKINNTKSTSELEQKLEEANEKKQRVLRTTEQKR